MNDYLLYWEDEGVPHEAEFTSRGDKTAVKHALRIVPTNLRVSNIRVTRTIYEG